MLSSQYDTPAMIQRFLVKLRVIIYLGGRLLVRLVSKYDGLMILLV